MEQRKYDFAEAAVFGFSSGIGWYLAIVAFAAVRQKLKYADLPKVDYTEEVEGVKAVDKYTLQFKLSREFPQFLYSLAMPFTFVASRTLNMCYFLLLLLLSHMLLKLKSINIVIQVYKNSTK